MSLLALGAAAGDWHWAFHRQVSRHIACKCGLCFSSGEEQFSTILIEIFQAFVGLLPARWGPKHLLCLWVLVMLTVREGVFLSPCGLAIVPLKWHLSRTGAF